MICASACTHDLLQSAVPPWAVVPSRQEALDGGIPLTIFEGCAKLTGDLLMANLEGSPILRWLLYIQRSFHPDPKHWKSVKELYSLRNTFRLQFFPSGHPHTRQGKGLGERDVSAVQ